MCFVRKLYVSDTHFHHHRILGLSDRPFANIVEHDEALIARWNAAVRDEDIVFHISDFALGLHDVERVWGLFFRLRGRKRLVLGNHDVDRDGDVHPTLAALPWDRPPSHLACTEDGGATVVMSHYALRTWPGIGKGAWHFYGHSHGKLPSQGRSRDVGVDVADVAFTPRTLDELTRGMR